MPTLKVNLRATQYVHPTITKHQRYDILQRTTSTRNKCREFSSRDRRVIAALPLHHRRGTCVIATRTTIFPPASTVFATVGGAAPPSRVHAHRNLRPNIQKRYYTILTKLINPRWLLFSLLTQRVKLHTIQHQSNLISPIIRSDITS